MVPLSSPITFLVLFIICVVVGCSSNGDALGIAAIDIILEKEGSL